MSLFPFWLWWPFLASLAVAVLLASTKRWHGRFTSDEIDGVQKVHHGVTPRVGGVPVVIGMLVALGFMDGEVFELCQNLLIASIPALLFGLVEDLTKRVGVRERLLATMMSGVIAWGLTSISLTRTGVFGLDAALSITIVSVMFTAVCVGGVANAINIIDGLNGLASTVVLSVCLGFGLVAYQVGDEPMMLLCATLALTTLGFWLINWPWGKLFLGDGGAYFLGFSLAWIAVLLLNRHSKISAFAMLLLCIHPVFEVLFSIYRRRSADAPPGMPDRLHFHSLFLRRFVRQVFPHAPRLKQNSVAGIGVGLMSLPLALLMPLVYDSTAWSVVALLVYVLVYLGMFLRMVGFHWAHPFRFVSTRARKRAQRYPLQPLFANQPHPTEDDGSDSLLPVMTCVGDHYRGYFVQHTLAVDIRIYPKGRTWHLQMKDEQNRQCLWPGKFDTPESALLAFSQALDNQGVGYIKSLFRE